MRHTDKSNEQQWPHYDQCQVLRDPSAEAARLLYTPHEIETVLDFLDSPEQGPREESETNGSHDAAADAIGELHHAGRQLAGNLVADRAEEFVDDGLEVTLCAKELQNREAEG